MATRAPWAAAAIDVDCGRTNVRASQAGLMGASANSIARGLAPRRGVHTQGIEVGHARLHGVILESVDGVAGITPQQSAITGYPEYEPGSGLRDLSFGTSLRTQYSDRWVGYLGASTSRLLGLAAASPLSQRLWGLNGGVAWRF